MPRIGQAVDAAEYRRCRPETGTARNQEHDQDLVFDRLDGGYSAEDLPRHHPGERHQVESRCGAVAVG